MRSKEVEEAINKLNEILKSFQRHKENLIEYNMYFNQDEEYIISSETLLNYISELEKENKYLRDENNIYKNETVSKSVIRDKIKELEEERRKIESSPYDK